MVKIHEGPFVYGSLPYLPRPVGVSDVSPALSAVSVDAGGDIVSSSDGPSIVKLQDSPCASNERVSEWNAFVETKKYQAGKRTDPFWPAFGWRRLARHEG